jgi:hypothetical protein
MDTNVNKTLKTNKQPNLRMVSEDLKDAEMKLAAAAVFSQMELFD